MDIRLFLKNVVILFFPHFFRQNGFPQRLFALSFYRWVSGNTFEWTLSELALSNGSDVARDFFPWAHDAFA